MSTAFWALVRKDIQLFLMDRRAVIMSFAVPILIASFFGYIFGGGGNREGAARIPILVADQDGSAVSHEIIASLAKQKTLDVKPADAAAARDQVRRGKATVAVIIPKDFGQNSGQAFFGNPNSDKPEVSLLYDPSHSAERGMVEGVLTGEIMQAVSKEMFGGATGRNMVNEALGQIQNSTGIPPQNKKALEDLLRSVQQLNSSQPAGGGPGGGLRIPFTTHDEAVTSGQNVEYNGYAHAFAGMTVQFVLFQAIDVGIGLLLQRQRGLWKRFRAAPLSRSLLLGSRTLSAAMIAFVVFQVNFLFSRIAFGVHVEGSLLGFLIICAAFSFAVAAFGLLIAALGNTPEGTRGLAIFVTLMAVMLGGAWIPTFVFPEWMQRLTIVVPTRWAIDGLDAVIWRGLGITSALLPAAGLLAFALLSGALAVSRFRWEEF
jgi:ABC-2 type transport system permease protein